MKDRHAATEGIEWRLMDVRDMQGVDDASVDVAFDKGTLDAMIHGSPWSPPQEVRDNTSAYLGEVRRFFFLSLSFPLALSPPADPPNAEFVFVANFPFVGPQGSQGQRPVSVRHVSAAAFYEAVAESGGIVGR
jgi:hypothetical protein